MKKLLMFVWIVMFWTATPLFAAVPTTISYQGVLTDSTGAPVTNAAQQMTFTLYDAATGGTALWTDTQSVDVQNGSYAVELGTTPNPLNASIFSGGQVWLEITVGTGTPMTPRQKLNSVPYAFEAVNAQTAATATTVTGTASGDGSGLTNLDWANIVNVPAGFADGTDDVATSVDGMSGGTISGGVSVSATGTTVAGHFQSAGDGFNATGIEGAAINNTPTDVSHTGVIGRARWGQEPTGVYGYAESGSILTTGILGHATGGFGGSGPFEGVKGLADATTGTNYALYGEAGFGPNGNYGLYARTLGTTWNANDYAGYLDGDAAVTGNLTVGTGTKDINNQLAVQTTHSVAGRFENNAVTTSGTAGIVALNNPTTPPSGSNVPRYGIQSSAGYAWRNYAVYGDALGSGYYNYAIWGRASGGTRNVAGYFTGDESDGLNTGTVEISNSGQWMFIDGNEIDSSTDLYLNSNSAKNVSLAQGGGNVGIGLTAPETTLHVAGGNWDVGTTEGDFKIGDASNRLKIGVATSGGGAGIARIYADGAQPKVVLGTGTTDTLAVSGGNVGIGTLTPSYKLYVVGDAYTTGTWLSASDRRFKKNITPLQNGLETISLLRGVHFDWRTDEFPERGFSDAPQIGVIAQEVEQVLPELVHTDDQGYKSVAYDKLSAVLIEAVKDLKARNETLQGQVDALRGLVCQDHPEAAICN